MHADQAPVPEFGRVLRALRHSSYADRLYGYWSHTAFFIGTAPSHDDLLRSRGEVLVAIEFDTERGLFVVESGELILAPLSVRRAAGIIPGREFCSGADVVSVVNRIVRRELER